MENLSVAQAEFPYNSSLKQTNFIECASVKDKAGLWMVLYDQVRLKYSIQIKE